MNMIKIKGNIRDLIKDNYVFYKHLSKTNGMTAEDYSIH